MPPTNRKYGMGRTNVKGAPFEVELPSGEVCLVKKAEPEDLILAGVLDSLDTLTALVSDLHVERVLKGKAGKAAAEASQKRAIVELIKDKERWEALMKMVDGAVLYCVVEPKVSALPPEGEKRNPDLFYIDEVALFDKFAVMNAAIGDTIAKAQAMEPFRAGPTATVGNLDAGEGVQRKAKRTARTR